MHHNIKGPKTPTTAAAHGFESHQVKVRAGSHEMPSRKRTQHMMRKTKCETNKLSHFLRIRKFHIYNTKFLAENQRSMPLQTKQLRLLLWPRGAKQRQFQCFTIEECASCSRSLVQWSTAICRLIQRNQQQKKQGRKRAQSHPPDPLLQLTRCILGNAKPQQQHNNAEDVRHVAA